VDIRINDQNLDFTIESNETLGDVVKDIEAWLDGSDLVLYSVKHEDQDLLAQPYEQWAETPHSEVGTLNVMVKHTQELTVLNLQTILEYLDLLKQAITAGKGELLGQLFSGFPALVESVRKHFPNPDAVLQALIALFLRAEAQEVLDWPEEKMQQAVKLIDLVSGNVSFRLQELQDPRAALKTLSGALKICTEEISEISILLQTGKDRQAMDTMVRFSELSQSLVRLVASVLPHSADTGKQVTVGGMGLQDFYQELNGILTELLEAFEAKDSVLIGDLMEYEVAPRLEQLRAFLQEVA
jgi:hypothetical protein